MTTSITPNPAIHNPSPQDTQNEANAAVAQLKSLFSQLPEMVLQGVVAFIKQETGIDLSGFLTLVNGLSSALGMLTPLQDFLPDLESALGGIDLSSPGAILTAIENAASSLTEQIASDLLSLVPLSSIGNVQPNLILNGSFDGSISMNGGSAWVWDGTVDHTGTAGSGSAKVVCNGTNEDLLSNGIAVAEGQEFSLSFWYQYSGLSASGAGHAISLSVAEYLNGAPVAEVWVCGKDETGSVTGASSGWAQATGTYTVPAGVDTVYVDVGVSSILTAGSVWLDDVEAKKTQLLAQELVDGLSSALTNLENGVQAVIDKILSALTGSPVTGGLVSAVETELAALQSAASGAATNLGDLVTDLETGANSVLSGINANNIVSGAISEAISGLAAARDAIAQGLGLSGSGGLSNAAAQNFAANVATVANQAAAAAASANATLAAQQAVTNANNGAGGNHATFNPSGADGAIISSSIAASTGVTSGDLCIRGSNGYIGMKSSLGSPAIAYGILNFLYATDNQSLILALGDQGAYDGAATYGYMHADTAHTSGAYVKITNDAIAIGSYTRSGSTYTYTPFSGGSVSTTVNANDSVEFRNVGTTWSVLVGGNQALSLTNASVTFSSSFRSAAVSAQRAHSTGFFGWGAGDFDSFRIAAISLSDIVAPTFVGSTGRLVRTSATAVNPTRTAGAFLMPTSFFGTATGSADLTPDLVNGGFTVSIEGTYRVAARVQSGGAIAGIGTNGVLAVSAVLVKISGGTTSVDSWLPQGAWGFFDTALSGQGPGPLSFGGSGDIYLKAGDKVTLGYGVELVGTTAANTWTLVGESTGVKTYMEMSLVNKSLA